MRPQVVTVGQKQVAGGAALDADVFFLHTFDQMRMKRKIKTVADSLSS